MKEGYFQLRMMAYMFRVGARIRERRIDRGWSQRDLAEKIGWSSRAVGKWELAEAVPRIDAQLALAEVFRIDPDELMTWQCLPGERGLA